MAKRKGGLAGANIGNMHHIGRPAPTKINDPGVREIEDEDGGTVFVIQGAKRSAQLEGIGTDTQTMLERFGNDNGVILPPEEAHKLKGWMETLFIIADELKAVGK